MKATKRFTSYEEYENWTESFENCFEYEEIPSLIDDGWKLSMDIMIDCKTWKTALRRFEKAFVSCDPEIKVWVDGMKESCECGYWNDISLPSWDATPEELKEFNSFGTFSWGIEEIDECRWYIFLNISGEYANRGRKAA